MTRSEHTTTASAVFAAGVVLAVMRGDWALARWAHRRAVALRALEAFDSAAEGAACVPARSVGRGVRAEGPAA